MTIRIGIHFTYALVCIFCFSKSSLADELHYNNILVGDRAAGMGGAYTAISDDPSGLYYNPSGIAIATGSGISGSMNSYHTSTTTYKNALGTSTNWERRSSSFIPSFMGIFQPLGPGKFGFSFAITDSIRENQDQTFSNLTETQLDVDLYVINFNNQDDTFNIGPSYAINISNDFSFGLTLYGYYREQERIMNQYIDISDSDGGDYAQLTNYYQTSEQGIKPIFGAMWSPWEKVSIGLNINKTFLLSADTEIQATQKAQGSTEISRTTTSSTEKRDIPLNIRIGTAYFHNSSLLLSADVSYYESVQYQFSGKEVYREDVINIALGGEYYFNPTWALRGGFYTNNANTPSLTTSGISNGSAQREHVDMRGIALSISHFSRGASLTMGINSSRGSGKAQLFQTVNEQTYLQDVEINTFTLFIGASYNY